MVLITHGTYQYLALQKEVIVENLSSGEFFTGADAKALIGLLAGEAGKVKKESVPAGYRAFIQSTRCVHCMTLESIRVLRCPLPLQLHPQTCGWNNVSVRGIRFGMSQQVNSTASKDTDSLSNDNAMIDRSAVSTLYSPSRYY